VGNLDGAADYYQRALDIDYDYYAAIGLALISKEKGEYANAIDTLSKLYTMEKNNTRLISELVECYVANNEKAKAMALLKTNIDSGNTHPSIKELFDELTKGPSKN
jgi:tetratricopeptide (TPR) repeat protein